VKEIDSQVDISDHKQAQTRQTRSEVSALHHPTHVGAAITLTTHHRENKRLASFGVDKQDNVVYVGYDVKDPHGSLHTEAVSL
jgi:hypothetical protein